MLALINRKLLAIFQFCLECFLGYLYSEESQHVQLGAENGAVEDDNILQAPPTPPPSPEIPAESFSATLLAAVNEKLSTPIENAYTSCCICLEQRFMNDMRAIVPCGHVCVCVGCTHMIRQTKQCPMCRSPTKNMLKLYFSLFR